MANIAPSVVFSPTYANTTEHDVNMRIFASGYCIQHPTQKVRSGGCFGWFARPVGCPLCVRVESSKESSRTILELSGKTNNYNRVKDAEEGMSMINLRISFSYGSLFK